MEFAIVDPIVFGCENVKNSGSKTGLCGVCGGDNSTCTDCEGKIRPGFVDNRPCAKLLCTIAAHCIVHRRIFELCCETCKGVIVICEVRRVESIESEKTSIENEENVCGVCGGDNSTCADCEGNIKPGFVINGSCDKFIDQLDGSRSARWLFQQKKLSKVLDKLQVVIFRKFSYFMVLNLSINLL